MEVEKSCLNCIFGKKLFASEDVICDKKGIVDGKTVCSKYSYNIFDAHKAKKRDVKNYNEDDFKL